MRKRGGLLSLYKCIGGFAISKKYTHIVVIGVDGAGAWVKDADTPNFDRIFENGQLHTTHFRQSQLLVPSVGAQCLSA